MKRPIKNQNRHDTLGGVGYERTFKMLDSYPIIHEIRTNYKNICTKFLGSVKGGRHGN